MIFLTFSEVEKLKGMLSEQDGGNNTGCQAESLSHDLKTARQEAAQAQENLKVNWLNLLMCFNFKMWVYWKYLSTAVYRKIPDWKKKVAGWEAVADWSG